ncbi:MAG: hypothetical protein FWG69_02270 [Oscillospiraceae bacterium]|nr:hypothetical protein [Oscillospiraceae bacterium]
MKKTLSMFLALVMLLTLIPILPALATDGSDINNAKPVVVNTTIQGNFDSAGKSEFYTFTAPVTGRYLLDHVGSVPSALRFTVYEDDKIAVVTGANGEFKPEINLVAEEVYYIKAAGANSVASGAYAFKIVEPFTPADQYGKGANFDLAISAAVNATIQGNFNVPGKADFYKFTAPVTGRYLLDHVGSVPSTLRFTVYEDDKIAVVTGANGEFKPEINLVAEEVYYIKAAGANSVASGTYAFKIVEPFTPADQYGKGANFDLAITRAIDVNIQGNFNVPGKADFYKFTATYAGAYEIKGVNNPPSSLRFTVYEDNKVAIVTGGNNIFEAKVNIQAGKTYFIKASGANSVASGVYTFIIESPMGGSVTPPTITRQPGSETLNINGTVTKLNTAGSVVNGGSLSFQWYSNNKNSTAGGKAIPGATNNFYSAPAKKAGITYYYCVLTNTMSNGKKASATTKVASVTVRRAAAVTPKITKQPKGKSLKRKGKLTLSITAKASPGKLSYQWFSNKANKNTGGKKISKANKPRYTPATKKKGTMYYYCAVTNTDNSAAKKKTIAISKPARVKVR